MEKVQVVAAVICRDNKFLLGKRATHKKSAPGYWSPRSKRNTETVRRLVRQRKMHGSGLKEVKLAKLEGRWFPR